jgi:hypothetical protein
VPFTSWPDRVDLPRNAARPLRFIDRFVTVTQGEVFYMTEVLAQLEGLERGPAGNTSLAAAFAIAQELPREATVVVQETEYTGAGKQAMGITVRRGDPRENKPGTAIVLPAHPRQITVREVDLAHIRRTYLRQALKSLPEGSAPTETDLAFLAADSRADRATIEELWHEQQRTR